MLETHHLAVVERLQGVAGVEDELRGAHDQLVVDVGVVGHDEYRIRRGDAPPR